MKFKSTYILVALAVGLGLFVYFYEIRGGKEREEAERKEKLAFHVKDEDITWMEIIRPGEEPLRVEKTGTEDDASWRIVKPIQARADDGAVGSMTWQLGEMSFSQIAADSPVELEPFGLATPELTVNFGDAGGAVSSLEFGKKLPVGADSYARVKGESRALVVGDNARAAFNKQTVDLRDKRVVVFKDDSLTALEISTSEYHVKLEINDKDWKITVPIKADAAEDKVDAALDGLRYLEAEEFFPAIVAQSLGITTPEMTVTIVSGAEERARQTVNFYRSADGNTGYARPEGDDWIYKIAPEIMDNIPAPVEELREKKVVKFDRWEIERVRVKPPDGAPDIVVTKNENGDWELEEPSGEKKKALSSVMYDLLDSIENLESDEYVDTPPAPKKLALKPALTLYKAVEGKGKKGKSYQDVATLELGGEADDGKRYARGGSQIFLIPADFSIPVKPEEYTTEPAAGTTPATLEFDEDETYPPH